MTKLSELLLKESLTVQAIYSHYKTVGESALQRGYLGASEIGHSCSRYLWYKYRNCCKNDLPGRIYRLFETGQNEEDRIAQNLLNIGYEVYLGNEKSEQFSVSFLGGHFSGHLDGCVKGIPEAPKTWHVLEDKTHNTKSFNKLKEEGVKKSKPMHYAQMMVYMHGTGMTRALYFAVCKETDGLYTERIRYDKKEAETFVEQARQIITSTRIPERLASRPDWYECKWCDAHDICWGCEKALPIAQISCKQCCYATPITEGEEAKWKCEKDMTRTIATLKGCPDHLCLPGLFPYAEPTDYADGMVLFKNKDDGKEWQHGGFCYSTKELLDMDRSQL